MNLYEKRIYNWQKKYGGLSSNVQAKIDKLLLEYEQSLTLNSNNKALSITNGTVLIREFKGKRYKVTVIADGFEFNGKNYKSLSAIANEITGTRWNGKKFFGVA